MDGANYSSHVLYILPSPVLYSYLHLNKLGHKCENLPYGVQMSPAGRDSTPDDS